MEVKSYTKLIRQLISQTPLIIDPSRDAPRFQEALANLPTEKLQAFYQSLNGEERRRFHYTATVCLGYESWSRLYQELVVQETRARLSDHLEEALSRREQELERAQETLEEELSRLTRENQKLLQENLKYQADLAKLQQDFQTLQRQQQKLLELVTRYKHLLQEVKRFLPKDFATPAPDAAVDKIS